MPTARRRPVRAVLAFLLGLAAVLGVALAGHAPAATRTTYTRGYDVSWPQCRGSEAAGMPDRTPAFLILGLTAGAGNTANPCLASQLAWARARQVPVGAYLVPSYPSRAELAGAATGPYGDCRSRPHGHTCRLHNAGAIQAIDAVGVMRQAGVPAPMVWVDVEFRGYEPWHYHQKWANRAVLAGVVRGLRRSGVPFGVYTTAHMWQVITGGYRLRVPNWLPSGDGTPGHARQMCTATATGGPTWLVQYTQRLDNDLTCPVLDPVPGRHSRLWRWRYTTLQLTDSGRAVKAAQRRLGVPASGEYDLGTSLAAARYERDHNLPVTGKVQTPEWRAWGAFRTVGGRPFGLGKIARRG